jgi:hypothetical protein
MKKLIISILKYSAAFVTALLVLEIFFRFSEVFLPSIVYDDPRLGLLRKPNAQIFTINEGFGMGSVNEFGYLGPGYPKNKGANTLRIALIGASMVQGLELFDRNHFRKLLEDKLSEITGKKVEVMNFGRGGIDLRGIYTTYKYIAAEYDPDINLIFTGDASFVAKDDKPGPDYRVSGDSLLIDYSFAESSQFKQRTKFKFLRLTSIGNLLKRGYEFYQLGSPAQFILGSLYKKPVIIPQNTVPDPVKVKDAFFEINRAIVNDFGKENKNRTKNIIIMTDRYPDYYDELISSSNIPVLNLEKEFERRKKAGENLDFWKGSNMQGHWNHHGHEAVAEFLFDYLKNLKF